MSSYHHHHFSFTSSFFYLSQNDQTAPPHPQDPKIPIPIPIQTQSLDSAATKIQSAYRSHLIRSLIRKILAVDCEADRLQALIQQQETVDSVRSNERERIRLNEALMGLLLRLDSVPGHFDPNVRELRRRISRRIVGLQEILDAIVGERLEGGAEMERLLPGSWDEFLERICGGEESERGGDDDDESRCCRWDDRKKVLRCLEKFLREM